MNLDGSNGKRIKASNFFAVGFHNNRLRLVSFVQRYLDAIVIAATGDHERVARENGGLRCGAGRVGGDFSEHAMRFVIGSTGVVQRVRAAGRRSITERESPELFDFDRMAGRSAESSLE